MPPRTTGIIERPGSCFTRPMPGFARLLHGSQPRCHRSARHRPQGNAGPCRLSAAGYFRHDRHDRLGRRTKWHPAAASQLNTSRLNAEEAARLLDAESARLGLPVADPIVPARLSKSSSTSASLDCKALRQKFVDNSGSKSQRDTMRTLTVLAAALPLSQRRLPPHKNTPAPSVPPSATVPAARHAHGSAHAAAAAAPANARRRVP